MLIVGIEMMHMIRKWFGIFIVLVVEMAQITPPVGFNLFVLQGMTGRQLIYAARVPLRCSFQWRSLYCRSLSFQGP
jgi:TRAP-type C4-dicarboxylate transport system permease large subunit